MAEEIKSTLEIALEKAEKLGKASKEELQLLEIKESAQRLAAKFLKKEISNFEEEFQKLLEGKNSQQKKVILQSIVDIFLKNIILPKTEYQLNDSKKAMEGLKIVFKKMPESSRLTQQVEKLLKEYYTHKQAIYNELVKKFSQGVSAIEEALSNQLGAEVKINVEDHPQFKEEWNKIKEKLDEEYARHLEYLKNLYKKIVY